MRRIIGAVAIAIALLASPIVWFVATRFVRYQPALGRIVSRVDREDARVSPEAAVVFRKMDGQAMTWLVTRSVLYEVDPRPVRSAEWSARGLVWAALLPLRLSKAQIEALYAHFMPFDGGTGVVYGARRYFGKTPSALTTTDALALVAISRSPRQNSPTEHPDAFERAYALTVAKYQQPPN